MSTFAVTVPDIGDAKDVEVIEICVESGATIKVDDALIVIESDKASMEVPAPVAGVVVDIHANVGDLVNTGDMVLSLQQADPVLESTVDDLETKRDGGNDSDMQADSDEQPEVLGVEKHATLEESSHSESIAAAVEVRIPDIGKAKGVTVVEVLAVAGDEVSASDPLVVVESDKASMEIPSGIAGTVRSLCVNLNDEVEEGALIAVISSRAPALSSPLTQATATEGSTDGDGDKESTLPSQESVPTTPPELSPLEPRTSPRSRIYAGPSVRRMAREWGVNLALLSGSGEKGRILKEDVQNHIKSVLSNCSDSSVGIAEESIELPDFSQFGKVEEVPLSRVRVLGAQNLLQSWQRIVHVTQHDDADVTELEEFRAKLNADVEDGGTRLSPLPFVLKACAMTLVEFPAFNASLHPSLSSLIVKRYFHLGMAVDASDGLVVPVLRDVDKKGISELAHEANELAELARLKRLKPDHIQGATFTVSSLGTIGGTGFTPIINPPEVAILGVARLTIKPVWDGQAFQPRSVLPLSLSYDHRAINGAEAGRFMQSLIRKLSDIRHLAL